MNLEAVEQHCVDYLGQTSSPLVPLSRLLRFVLQADAEMQIDEGELLEFLRPHPLFKVIDPLDAMNGSMEVQVALAVRIPSQTELTKQIQEQLLQMLAALEKAEHEAEAGADGPLRERIREMRLRAEMMQKKLDSML